MSKVYEMVAEGLILHLGLDPELVRPEATFTELGVDSLAMIELALILEDAHGIDAEGIDPASTLAQAAAYLEHAIAALDSATADEPRPAAAP
jgi:acyl carrier protein